ncbi:methylmalonyl Co-A mutase-associated GTPase MeaB [Flavisolibacter ginsenosidimutans]|uniref:Methylmalonyl Co-A mutase-associated GTPase MeaB n=1 Tax=Flavisolibacter ginsenosidimutans TaxID=661481 RepID=A0A5B8ULW9_9BACT|nr:methylmalonyl Co-A mutase-associated GTPase MeaB [Flavisolibacter ginsenosidimutans]QEC57332.1 methylmalonyl Co-A mutase-associated GTPase MeaB [Flavisolibacter ginsenosidimutans]
MWQQLLQDLKSGDARALARIISLVENEHEGYEAFLLSLSLNDDAKIIGVTGPPGAGKSTLVDALIGEAVNNNKKVAVLCVDPSSPFNLGAVLGDRIRMSNWYTHPKVFIRSLATRGSMGGLHPKIIEITDVIKAAAYDYIIVETVGVGQSEIEIAGLADTTVVVLVPEAGDEVQTMKAGLMEIADVFVVNKSDRPDADAFVKNLRLMLSPAFHQQKNDVEIIKTVASTQQGIADLYSAIQKHLQQNGTNERKAWLLAERAYHLLQQKRMKGIQKSDLRQQIERIMPTGRFNLYRFVYGIDEAV